MKRFIVRLYSDFGRLPQEETRILFESDSLTEVKNYIKEYFKYESYFNAVYFTDTKLNKSGYVGRNLKINCGENLFDFCGLALEEVSPGEIKTPTIEECINRLETLFKSYQKDSEFNYQLNVEDSPWNILKRVLNKGNYND